MYVGCTSIKCNKTFFFFYMSVNIITNLKLTDHLVWWRCSSLNFKDSVSGAPQTALQKGTSESYLDHLSGLFQLEIGPSGGSVGVWV